MADESGTICHTRPRDMHQPSCRRRPVSGHQPPRARHMGSSSCRSRPARTMPGRALRRRDARSRAISQWPSRLPDSSSLGIMSNRSCRHRRKPLFNSPCGLGWVRATRGGIARPQHLGGLAGDPRSEEAGTARPTPGSAWALPPAQPWVDLGRKPRRSGKPSSGHQEVADRGARSRNRVDGLRRPRLSAGQRNLHNGCRRNRKPGRRRHTRAADIRRRAGIHQRMTNRRIPGGLEQFNGGRPPNEVGPRETIPGGPDTITNTDQSTDTQIKVAASCRCAYGEVCVCDFYAEWAICWPLPRLVPEQLRARRAASWRLPRLHCGSA